MVRRKDLSKFAGLPSSSRKENDNMPVRFPCAGSVLLSSSGRWRCIYFSFFDTGVCVIINLLSYKLLRCVCMYVCICVYVCIRVCMCVYICVCVIINLLSYKLLWCVCMYMCVIINLLSYDPPREPRVLLQSAASLQFDLFRGSEV